MPQISSNSINASVVDLFCGAGGLSHGFFQEGISIAAGYDIDQDCRYPYEENNQAKFICADVSKLSGQEVEDKFLSGRRRVLVGCAPCQPFSTYNQKNSDPNWNLLSSFGGLISDIRPDIVSMENVPQLVKFNGGKLFGEFIWNLKSSGYHVVYKILFGPNYGLPQTRSRLVLLASRLGPIKLPKPVRKSDEYRTVKDAIGRLPALEAGGEDPNDRLHRCSGLSPINLERIRASKPGGTWRDWPKELVTSCHLEESGRGYSSVYGRMKWSEPSPTITTQFYGFGNGRFGHPEQDRALSLREGAVLQGFPEHYKFVKPDGRVYFTRLGQMIGNAVPVTLSKAIACSVKEHLLVHDQ